jgi:hypothetical protein
MAHGPYLKAQSTTVEILHSREAFVSFNADYIGKWAGVGNFSLHHYIQNGSGAHPASYPVGTRGSFPGGKAAGA